MIKVVLDTNVLVSAVLNPHGKPALLFKLALGGMVELVISPSMIKKLRGCFRYPKLFKLLKKNGITPEEIGFLLNQLRTTAVNTAGKLQLDVIKDDPSDNLVLACAVEGKADFIVSGDDHLKALRTFEGIEILYPATFLKLARVKDEK
jgi:putative PIN family toxin of toxin-antitoxin system